MKLLQIAMSALFFVVYSGIHVYIAWVLAYVFPVPLLPLVLLLQAAAYVYVAGIRFPVLKTAGAIWFAFLHFFVLALPLLHLAVLVASRWFPWDSTVTAATAAGVLLMVVYWGVGLYNAYSPVVRRHTIHIQGASEPFTFAFASDMHFGGLSNTKHVHRLVDHLNELHADMILLCGDIVDDDPHVFADKGQDRILGKLDAPKGIYAVTGNHEYYGQAIPALREMLHHIGIELLEDETRRIDELVTIVGRSDKTNKSRSTPEALLDTSAQPVLVMDHQPTSLHELAAAGADISLSGHTHRGQIWPYNYITKRMFPLDWGYHRFEQMHAFVSCGFGFWGPPVRLGSRSELVYVEVVPEKTDT
ncbi:metallophosphoesterase [Alkalicoccus chagannorensis]|uniref:metallophosphoesterase n=1 Tax=Alkalicoccus chagannorensis TaxID=427072 RepID=UPI000415D049|nr:metallophosphoesterase [Alkalicoccus chagannorensis]